MSRVWLCQYPVAKHPLKVKTGVNLYSFEELCYYLYQNAEAVEESFYNEILCQWLEQEIRNQELARRLSEGLQEEQGGCWFIEQILKVIYLKM